MYSKLSFAFVAALAVASEASLDHNAHEKLHKRNETFPGPSGSGAPLPPGLAPFSTGLPIPSSGPAPSGAASSTGGVPLTTGAPLSAGGTGSGSSPSSAGSPEQSGDTTLTYTVGTGSSTTVITTTIHHTVYQTNTNVSALTIHVLR